jgi:hypothetical protein
MVKERVYSLGARSERSVRVLPRSMIVLNCNANSKQNMRNSSENLK